MRLISQLINRISEFLQKLLKYFNGTIVWTSSVLVFLVEPVIFLKKLNKTLLLSSTWKFFIALVSVNAGSSL